MFDFDDFIQGLIDEYNQCNDVYDDYMEIALNVEEGSPAYQMAVSGMDSILYERALVIGALAELGVEV